MSFSVERVQHYDYIINIEWVATPPKMRQCPIISQLLTSTEYFLLTQLLQVADLNHPLNVNKKY
jgi:hypothetical protein